MRTEKDRQPVSGRALATVSACVLTLLATSAAASEPGKLPIAASWQIKGELDEKEKVSISGLRCVEVAARRSCLMLADEERFARRLKADGTTLVVGDEVGHGPDDAGPRGLPLVVTHGHPPTPLCEMIPLIMR